MFIKELAVSIFTLFNCVKPLEDQEPLVVFSKNNDQLIKKVQKNHRVYSSGELVNSINEGNKDLVIETLKNQPELINQPDHNGTIPLHAAVARNNEELVLVLLDRGASINIRCELDNSTALHIVKSVRMACLLIKRGALLNSEDCWKETPLHRMASLGKKDIILLLLKYPSVRLTKNLEGNTAYDIAYERWVYYKRKGILKKVVVFEAICKLVK